jgi:HK97 family phage portal protein
VITGSGAYKALAPQAFSETSPQFHRSYFTPRLGVPLETSFASYGQLYRAQPYVRAAVDKVAHCIARLGIRVWDETPPAGKEIDLSSPYAELMARPCPTRDNYSFWNWVASTIEIYGETFLLKIREGRNGQLSQLLPMHPSMTHIERDEEGFCRYKFMGRPNETFTENDVVPFVNFNPDGTMRGMSRLESLRSTLMTEDSARRSMQAWWQNSMRPSVIMRAKRELGDDGRDRVIKALSSQHGGSGNRGRIVVFENDEFEDPTIIQNTAEDMQYIEGRQLAREEVCAVMDLPPSSIQDMSRATFSNIVENGISLYRDSICPRIDFIESVLDYHIGTEFNGPKVARFAVGKMLKGDWEKRAAAHAQLVQNLIEKPNEARHDLDLEADSDKDADKLWGQQQLVVMGTPPARTAGPGQPALPAGRSTTPPPEGPATNRSGDIAKYVRDIGALVGRGQTLNAAAQHVINKTGDHAGVKAAFEYLLEHEL